MVGNDNRNGCQFAALTVTVVLNALKSSKSHLEVKLKVWVKLGINATRKQAFQCEIGQVQLMDLIGNYLKDT